MERRGKLVVVQGEDHLRAPERRLVPVGPLDVERSQRRHPPVTMDDVRAPAQLLDGLEHAAGIEDGARVVVFILHPLVVHHLQPVLEIVVVVDEIDLHAGRLDRSHLDDERVVGIVDDKVHARQPDYLVQLVPAFVDVPPLGHERPDFSSPFLNGLRQAPAHARHLGLGHIRSNFLRNK